MGRIISTILFILILAAAGWIFLVYSGSYDVSMSNHDNVLVNWSLDTGTTRSVKRHAADGFRWV
ncbi:MAG: hypothetical protein WA183_05535 [Chthoniobacterales bacterium]